MSRMAVEMDAWEPRDPAAMEGCPKIVAVAFAEAIKIKKRTRAEARSEELWSPESKEQKRSLRRLRAQKSWMVKALKTIMEDMANKDANFKANVFKNLTQRSRRSPTNKVEMEVLKVVKESKRMMEECTKSLDRLELERKQQEEEEMEENIETSKRIKLEPATKEAGLGAAMEDRDPSFDHQFQNKGKTEALEAKSSSTGASSDTKKTHLEEYLELERKLKEKVERDKIRRLWNTEISEMIVEGRKRAMTEAAKREEEGGKTNTNQEKSKNDSVCQANNGGRARTSFTVEEAQVRLDSFSLSQTGIEDYREGDARDARSAKI